MRQSILGIDLGTSSVKLLQWYTDGTVRKVKETYDGSGCESWIRAVYQAVGKIDASSVTAVGLSSQVGTYVVDGRDVISWRSPEGKEELDILRKEIGADVFLREISMPHPEIHSYPIPRLMYIKKHYGNFKTVCQPKDFLCEALTGNRVTDLYSWRGLANLETAQYSEWGLAYAGIEAGALPPVMYPWEKAGEVSNTQTGLKPGIPVYIGCNDFFAGLLGMGVRNEVFDITGTSEHIGVLTKQIIRDTKMVSGPYFQDFIHYGVTASSGASMDFCLKNFSPEADIEACIRDNPPIFLPYLNGERAPIWNPDARGVFFGISGQCEKRHLAYSVMEGIVFSLYHIYTQLSAEGGALIVTGGAAKNLTLNTLKAELFGMPVRTLKENDTSAMGAVMLAGVGNGLFDDLENAAHSLCKTDTVIYPTGAYRDILLKRFELYKKLYPSLEALFTEKENLTGGR